MVENRSDKNKYFCDVAQGLVMGPSRDCFVRRVKEYFVLRMVGLYKYDDVEILPNCCGFKLEILI